VLPWLHYCSALNSLESGIFRNGAGDPHRRVSITVQLLALAEKTKEGTRPPSLLTARMATSVSLRYLSSFPVTLTIESALTSTSINESL
jgi:hypothetical protein